ncbi:MAG: N-acetylmuramoyl-L-alanine amidase [Enterococcus sp.]
MKLLKKVLVVGIILLIGWKLGLADLITRADQTTKTQSTTTEQTTEQTTKESTTKTTTTKLVQTVDEDQPLYTTDSFTEVSQTVNEGEFTTLVEETSDGYKVKTDAGNTGYLMKDAGKIVEKTETEKPTSIKGAVIVLDPGHGGDDTGALSNDENTYEKTVTLATAKQLKSDLEAAGATVYLTHSEDHYISLDDICEFSTTKNADLFISLHADSTEYANEATGITTYYYYDDEKELADTVENSFSDLPLASRGTEYGNYQVLRENLQSSILIEMGYMNNDSDLSYLTSSSYQEQLSSAVTEAVKTYFSEN